MLAHIWNRLFYDPYRAARRHNVQLGDSVLDRSFAIHAAQGPRLNSLSIGNASMIACQVHFETTDAAVSIGDNTFINTNTMIIASRRITIGSWVTIAWGVVLYDHDSHSLDATHRMEDHRRQLADQASGSFIRSKDWSTVARKPIRVEDHAWIGFDAVILKGVTIGRGAIVGARSVVTRDVEPFTVVAGNPARLIKRLDPPAGLKHTA